MRESKGRAPHVFLLLGGLILLAAALTWLIPAGSYDRVLDEATAGLDPLARDAVLDILRQFMEQEGHGILMSTHITSDLEKIADKVVCIDEGRIVFDLDKDAISDQAAIGRCRKQDFEAIAASGFFPAGEMRFQSHGFGTDVLVPDRFAFARQFPDVALDRISIEEYMTLVLKGETR